MALDQSALLEVLDALKAAAVGDRVRAAAGHGPTYAYLLVDHLRLLERDNTGMASSFQLGLRNEG